MNAPRKWELPDGFYMKLVGNRCGVAVHEMHAEIAEYRLRHDGETSDELMLYLAGIALEYGR